MRYGDNIEGYWSSWSRLGWCVFYLIFISPNLCDQTACVMTTYFTLKIDDEMMREWWHLKYYLRGFIDSTAETLIPRGSAGCKVMFQGAMKNVLIACVCFRICAYLVSTFLYYDISFMSVMMCLIAIKAAEYGMFLHCCRLEDFWTVLFSSILDPNSFRNFIKNR